MLTNTFVVVDRHRWPPVASRGASRASPAADRSAELALTLVRSLFNATNRVLEGGISLWRARLGRWTNLALLAALTAALTACTAPPPKSKAISYQHFSRHYKPLVRKGPPMASRGYAPADSPLQTGGPCLPHDPSGLSEAQKEQLFQQFDEWRVSKTGPGRDEESRTAETSGSRAFRETSPGLASVSPTDSENVPECNGI
jgi:hypothetical protein